MAPDAKGADSGPSRMERPATHTGEGYKLVMDVGGGGRGQHRLRSLWEQGRSLSSGDAGGRWS